jgi:phage gp29-like protein
MAETLPTLFRRGLERVGLMLPNDGASPEDEGAPPIQDRMISRDPTVFLSSAWMGALKTNDDSILQRDGGGDLGLFDRLLDDDVAFSNLQQRRLAITSRDWEVTPGDDKDARSVQAGEDFREMLDEVGFDRVTGLLHYAIWFGYGVGEAIWTTRPRPNGRKIWLSDIVVPDRRWFGFTHEGELRIASLFSGFEGEALPPNKFFTIRTGGSHDFAFYGLGLAHWCYFPVWFKRAATRFWALFLEKLANPTAVGEFKDSMSDEEKNKLLATLVAIGQESAALVPEGSADKISFMEAQRAVSGSPFKDFVTEQNESIMRIVLGQPGTSKATPQGVGGKQSEVHADVKAEIVKADSDLICEALNNTLARWVTAWNYGPDVKPPKVFRVLDDAEDLNTIAERDVSLKGLGWTRTEDSFEQVYGEGYEYNEPKPPPALGGRKPGDPAANDDEADDEQDGKAATFSAAEEAAIERLTAALADETNPVIREFAASIQGELAKAKEASGGELSLEGARVALLQAFEAFDPAELATVLGMPFVAMRAASEAGIDENLNA